MQTELQVSLEVRGAMWNRPGRSRYMGSWVPAFQARSADRVALADPDIGILLALISHPCQTRSISSTSSNPNPLRAEEVPSLR